MSTPFYEKGLQFACTRCSRCCRHQPGYVFLSETDLARLQTETGMERHEFVETYCRQVSVNGFIRLSLKEKPNFDCIFWENGGCGVYRNRPLQCRSYPFWPSNLDSQESWDELEKECPGVNIGRIHLREEIDGWVAQRRSEPLVDGHTP